MIFVRVADHSHWTASYQHHRCRKSINQPTSQSVSKKS